MSNFTLNDLLKCEDETRIREMSETLKVSRFTKLGGIPILSMAIRSQNEPLALFLLEKGLKLVEYKVGDYNDMEFCAFWGNVKVFEKICEKYDSKEMSEMINNIDERGMNVLMHACWGEATKFLSRKF